MALKRKRSSSAHDSHQRISSISSTDAENHQPVSDGEETQMRKRRRTESFSDQITVSEDSPQDSVCAPVDPGLQEPLSSRAPSPLHHSLDLFPNWFKSVSERSDSQERVWRTFSSAELRSLYWSCGSAPAQAQEHQTQTTAAVRERHAEDETCPIIGRKRKRGSQVCDSHQRSSSTSHTDAAENHRPVSVGEENETPMRKRRRTESFGKLPSLHFRDGGQAEDQSSLQGRACAREDPEVLPPAGQRVQTPPVRPAPGHRHRVDRTTEGNILSRYNIGRMLGEGSFGSVYEGQRLEDGLEVAVKFVIKPNPREMKYINIPDHPAPVPLEVGLLILANNGPKVPEIIELLDWQDERDRYIMVLERPSSCQDLFDFLEDQDGILNEDTARFVMAQTTTAAYTCCQRGVFHRDIKLENLLVNTETTEVKLIDFGCGDLLLDSGYKRFSGTLKYRPPESLAEGKYHAKPSTVWSLGVLLFLLVCGRYPKSRDRRRINKNIWTIPGLSNECCHLIRSLLQGNPRKRIELRDVLQHEWFKQAQNRT